MELTNQEIIERINAWQTAGFIHPLTCRKRAEMDGEESLKEPQHDILIPDEVDGKIILKCPTCGHIQNHVPSSVLEVTPEMIAETEKEMKEMGFKFD